MRSKGKEKPAAVKPAMSEAPMRVFIEGFLSSGSFSTSATISLA